MEIQVGDMILICSDGVYGNGKWSVLKNILTNDETASYPLSDIERLAADKAHDNYSAILIRVCQDEPVDKTDSYLFKLRRQLKDGNSPSEHIEFFRTRREAMYRLVERNCFGYKNDKYHYGVSCFPDGQGAKWKINENKQ